MPATRSVPGKASYDSIDDVLGARERRFFGEGFKRTTLRTSAIRVVGDPDGKGELTARASVDYPSDWSRKGEMDQRPHLSTIDIILIGAELSDVYLAHTIGLREEQRRAAVIRRIRIKAGNSPVESGLTDLPVSAKATTVRAPDGADHPMVTGFDCTVASLRVHCEIHHHPDRPNLSAGEFASPAALLGDPRHRMFGEGYKARSQLLEHIEAQADGNEVQALTRTPTDPTAPPCPGGIEGNLHAAATAVDSFTIGLQLGQLLLYRLDDLPRARSNTLWMRQTLIDLDPRRPSLPSVSPAAAHLERTRLLETGRGEVWRSADIVSDFQGIGLRCAVAHRLP